MQIFITLKSLSRRKGFIEKKPFEIEKNPLTLEELIQELLSINVNSFNQKEIGIPFLPYLTQDEINMKSTVGKIGFNEINNDTNANVKEAISTALLAFQDGLFKVFLNDNEIESLQENIDLHENDEFTFIKLTMLSGRMW
ncbi:hypothetical protein V7148_12490 [Gottfriedia acidiceleris]|uniref:hypothetical protein n=2 Tax=Bacillales TaxID=1385 RepID=UPI000BEB648B|nr:MULTISPECIES: hypothetical protein [unclassified Bacillus (in: firmicutes)]PEC48592.1 hypothetical protein CON00_13455 [Bacillus sp. AFS096315]PFM82586.1 hypothetical protein COJ46_01885 [Bacillus sp. AFS077874]